MFSPIWIQYRWARHQLSVDIGDTSWLTTSAVSSEFAFGYASLHLTCSIFTNNREKRILCVFRRITVQEVTSRELEIWIYLARSSPKVYIAYRRTMCVVLRIHCRKWEKGRGTVIQFNPRIGSIDAMSVDLENPWMLVASSELGNTVYHIRLDQCAKYLYLGMAVKCNPSTGKVDRHRLYSTDDGVPMRVSVVKIEGWVGYKSKREIWLKRLTVIVKRQRILWGFHAGFVTMTVRTKTVVGRQLKVFAEFHQGCVTALDLPAFTSDVALSASENGNIKIWDILTGTCAENLYGKYSIEKCWWRW